MRVGDQCVFFRYRRTIRPGARIFAPGDIIVATEKTGDVSWIFHGVDADGAYVPWLCDQLHLDEFVRLRYAPMISKLPGPVGSTAVSEAMGGGS